jgi:cobalt-zinc-cadmium efflux system membrane fusion protein
MTGRILPVEGLHATVGQRVKKGQTVITLQPSYIMHDALHLINQRWPILQSTMDARRRMLESQVRLERLQLALADQAVATGEVQLAETVAAEARQEYQRWSRTLQMHDVQIKDDQLARLPVVSPIDGEIAVANFAQGQLVYEGQALFTLVDISTVWVETLVPEHMAPLFQDRTVVFTAAPFPGEEFKGRLQRVAPSVDPVSRTLSHFYAVPNPGRLLRIGMTLHVAPAAGAHEETY